MAFVIADRVKETTTSTGTGALTLSGAMTGFRTFASKCSVGDTCYYAIQAVDAYGGVTGAWECGLGTYSSANSLTRTLVTASSNADAAVDFAAGTKQVYITVPAVQAAWPRERLTAARTYYVATTGSDSNNGLTAGAPFLTIQKAIDVVGSLDLGIYSITVQLANGTYAENVTFKSYIGTGPVVIQGDTTTPANVHVNPASGAAFLLSTESSYTIKGIKISAPTMGVHVVGLGSVSITSGNEFGACGTSYAYVMNGGVVSIGNAVTISGGSTYGFVALNAATISTGAAFTLTGTPALSQVFALARTCSVINFEGASFSGSATGKRYDVTSNSVVWTAGQATTWLPGSIAGTTTTGGQYA